MAAGVACSLLYLLSTDLAPNRGGPMYNCCDRLSHCKGKEYMCVCVVPGRILKGFMLAC